MTIYQKYANATDNGTMLWWNNATDRFRFNLSATNDVAVEADNLELLQQEFGIL